jgi:hypothetical protein
MNASLWDLRADGPRRVAAGLMVLFAAYAALGFWQFMAHLDVAHPDFFGLWSFARFVHLNPASEIYAPGRIVAFQHELDPGFGGSYGFSYPPVHLLDLWPLGLLPYRTAHVAWITVTGAVYVAAIAAPAWRGRMILAAVLVPAATIAAAYGQSGFLSAALTIGGLRLLTARPVVAGMVLGCLCFKPQLALLVPVALIAGRHWTTIASAVLTAAALVLASSVAFGFDIWPSWIAAIPRMAGSLEGLNPLLDHIKPTLTANLQMLGVAPRVAGLAQLAAGIGCAVLIWACARRGGGANCAAVLPVATFLATPYAFVYDLPMLAGGILLAFAAATRDDRPFNFAEVLILTLGLLLPVQMFTPLLPPFPVSTLVIAPVLWVLARRALTSPETLAGSR